eukprot:Em0008g895a
MKWECHQSTHLMTALVQVLTGTYHSGIFAVPTIVCPDLGMGTFQETLLPTGAQDLIQPHGPHPLPKVGCPGGIGCRAVAQHPAHHISVLQDPPIITHRAPPLAVVVHLHAWIYSGIPSQNTSSNQIGPDPRTQSRQQSRQSWLQGSPGTCRPHWPQQGSSGHHRWCPRSHCSKAPVYRPLERRCPVGHCWTHSILMSWAMLCPSTTMIFLVQCTRVALASSMRRGTTGVRVSRATSRWWSLRW